MDALNTIRYVASEIRTNATSIGWWRNRVLVPYVLGTATRFHPRYPGYDDAIDVMAADWDNLIVLDACRADAFEALVDTSVFDEYERVVSLGSHSSEWTERNFAGRSFGDTVYVSANPHTAIEAADSFHELVELQRSDFDERMQTVLPERVSEAAIDTHETYPDKRLIVHFMQPHGPFVHEDASPPPFEGGDEEFWKQYARSVRHVVTYARELAAQFGGKTVITADHGQTRRRKLSGLFEINPHPPRFRLPELVTVPWATIDGERREIRAGATNEAETGDDLEERLRYLGYA